MGGTVLAIYVAKEKGGPMERQRKARAMAGKGLEGDRYGAGEGSWSKDRRVARDVTFISREAIDESNAMLDEPFSWEETRRNIVTTGVDLNALVGKEFRVGTVRMRGVEFADPCGRPTRLANKPDFKDAFENRGGLRATILNDGEIDEDDVIEID